jgi:hypothetical protein
MPYAVKPPLETKRICNVPHVRLTCGICSSRVWTQKTATKGMGAGLAPSSNDRYVCKSCLDKAGISISILDDVPTGEDTWKQKGPE